MVSLALGTSAALSIVFLLSATVLSTFRPFLLLCHFPIRSLLVIDNILHYLSSLFLLGPAVVSFMLVFIWRHSPDPELTLGGRCRPDIDVVWSVTSANCRPPAWDTWLALSTLRVIITLAIIVSYNLTIPQVALYSKHIRQIIYHMASSAYHNTRHPRHKSQRQLLRRRLNPFESIHPSLTPPQMPSSADSMPSPPSTLPRRSFRSSRASSLRRPPSRVNRNSGRIIGGSRLPDSEDTSGDETYNGLPPSLHNMDDSPNRNSPEGNLDLDSFVDQFRSLVSQITRETEDSLEFPRPDFPTGYESTSSLPIASSSSPSDCDSHQYNPPTLPSPTLGSGGSKRLYPLQENIDILNGLIRRIPRPQYNPSSLRSPTLGCDILGRPNRPDENVRILGSFIRRMPTIESIGSREIGSMARSSIYGGSDRGRGWGTSSKSIHSRESMDSREIRSMARSSIYGSGDWGHGRGASLKSIQSHESMDSGQVGSMASSSIDGGSNCGHDGEASSKSIQSHLPTNDLSYLGSKNEDPLPLPIQRVVTAQLALEHATTQFPKIGSALSLACRMPDAAYLVRVGFDEDMMCRGQGALQEIYIYVDFDIPSDSNLVLDELGKILSPFPSILFTPTMLHRVPIVSATGEVLHEKEAWELFENCHIFQRSFSLCNGLLPNVLTDDQTRGLGHSLQTNGVEQGGGTEKSPSHPVSDNVGGSTGGNGVSNGSGGTGSGGDGDGASGGDGSHDQDSGDSGAGGGHPGHGRLPGDSPESGGSDPEADPGGNGTKDCRPHIATLDIPLSAVLKVKWDQDLSVLQSFTTSGSEIHVMVSHIDTCC